MILLNDVLNAKNTAWWGDFTDYTGGIISNLTDLHGLHDFMKLFTNQLIFIQGKILLA